MSWIILGCGNPNGSTPNHPIPMVVGTDDDDDTWALFKSRIAAERAAAKHPFFSAVGYKVVEWPYSKPNQPEKNV
jgi:hypothetical protein